MRFCDSKFNDEDWKNFTANAKQYPNLKLLLLSKITFNFFRQQ